MSAEPILSVSSLSASYHSKETTVAAVRNVSLELHRGEILALVGESASGKSTVALATLGLLPSNAEVEGEVFFDGVALSQMDSDELRRIRGEEIAIIFQDAHLALTPTLQVGQQVAELFQEHRGLSQRDANAAAAETLSRVLPDEATVAKSYPFQLSGGMAQRVLISMTMALEPSVIIADEPTSSLDLGVRQETLQWLEQLRDGGDVAVLLITHDLGVVARLADRVEVMYAGGIVESADVRTLFREPKHPYTFGLLSSLPGGGRWRHGGCRPCAASRLTCRRCPPSARSCPVVARRPPPVAPSRRPASKSSTAATCSPATTRWSSRSSRSGGAVPGCGWWALAGRSLRGPHD